LLRFVFFTATTPTEIYTLSLHDALPILAVRVVDLEDLEPGFQRALGGVHPVALEDREIGDGELPGHDMAFRHGRGGRRDGVPCRSEEHTSELQSRSDLVCRLLLEKKKYV